MAGGSAMLLSFPVLLLAQQVDWTNPSHLMMARVAFIVIQAACFLLGKFLVSVSSVTLPRDVAPLRPPLPLLYV